MFDARPRNLVLLLLCVVVTLSTGVVAVEFLDSRLDPSAGQQAPAQADRSFENRDPVAPPANGTTVVTAQKFRTNFLVAFAPDGRVLYYDDDLDRYHDVDPAPNGTHTVEFVGAVYDGDTTYEVIRRVNLSTGRSTELYRFAVPRSDRPHRWHDVDRLDEHRFLVADIRTDSVFVVNTTTGERTYEWNATEAYDTDSGGSYPHDWTHLNDVERLPDGRYMASLRNQDSVIFLDPGEGIERSWTLGADDRYRTLNEQHNPDFIPAEDGAAVLVADSQNRRVVEYRRENGSWVRTWVWTDDRMTWPRDADRLPNGHTLVGDTNSGRVFEVDERGKIVWRVAGLPSYDVERLGTGDESSGGVPAGAANLTSRSAGAGADGLRTGGLAALVPSKLSNTVEFVAPLWLSPTGQAAAVLALGSVLASVIGVVATVLGRQVRRRRSR